MFIFWSQYYGTPKNEPTCLLQADSSVKQRPDLRPLFGFAEIHVLFSKKTRCFLFFHFDGFALVLVTYGQNLPSLLTERNINSTFSILAYDANALIMAVGPLYCVSCKIESKCLICTLEFLKRLK